MAAHPWGVVAVALIASFALWVASTRTQSHEIRAAFSSAISVAPGLDVQVNGIDIGKVTSVNYREGFAIVGIGIDDERFWPLNRGTTATLRYGTTAGNGTRRIDVVPGPKTAPKLSEGAIIAARDARAPVEFDEIFRTLDQDTRGHMRSLTRRTARTLDGRARRLNDGLRDSAPAIGAASGLMGELADDREALRGVITNTNRVVQTLDARRHRVADLVDVAALTFEQFAAHTRDVKDSIALAPRTLVETRTTLRRLDRSLGTLTRLVHDAAPGAANLAPLAAAARPAVARLTRTAPRLTTMLQAGRKAAPQLTQLLTEGTPFARRLTPILGDLAPLVGCLRPYAPELAGALSTWASFSQNYDASGHFGRVRLLGGPTSLTSTPAVSSATVARTTGLKFALPRAPGLNAGKPRFMPECGAGSDSVDPAKDREDER